MWGIIPAAGRGSRIQPLAFSKELLPVGGRDGENHATSRAVSDYLIERLVIGGAERLCFVISHGKSDIMDYYGGSAYSADICYSIQPQPAGLCDAVFRAIPFVDLTAPVLIGLPDTVWFPVDALRHLSDDRFSLLLFPVDHPEHFDAVVTDAQQRVVEVQVKQLAPSSHWIWGAFKIPGPIFQELHDLWKERNSSDEYFGTLINAWIARGGVAYGVPAGVSYFDVGTIDSYLNTIRLLHSTSVETRSTL
jgi:glucose-1-phosphate thymidylyltransferase